MERESIIPLMMFSIRRTDMTEVRILPPAGKFLKKIKDKKLKALYKEAIKNIAED